MKAKIKWLPIALAALSLTLWCACVFNAQKQSDSIRCVAVRWNAGGVSPARLESQLDIFREDGTKGIPEMTLWTELPGQRLVNSEDDGISCDVTQIYGHGEDVFSNVMLQGGYPARGDAAQCALSDTAAFKLFGSAQAMGQTLTWNGRNYTVQGIFNSDQNLMLTQESAVSESVMPSMRLRFADGGSRQQAEEFLARTSFSMGAIMLDMPLIAWGLEALAALPALLLGFWILARLIARAWQKRKYPRLLLTDLPLLLPLGIAAAWLSFSQLKLPAALIPSEWSDFSFWSDLPKNWSENLTSWLRHPSGGDIELIFAALGIFALVFLAMISGVWVLSRVKIQKPMHVLTACGGCIAWTFVMAMYYRGLRVSLAMWLLPCLWIIAEFALYAWGRKEGKDEAVAQNAEGDCSATGGEE